MLADALVGGELRAQKPGGLALRFDGRGLVGADYVADGAHGVVAHLVRVGQLGGGDVGALAVNDFRQLGDGLAVGGLQRLDVEIGGGGGEDEVEYVVVEFFARADGHAAHAKRFDLSCHSAKILTVINKIGSF